MEFYTEILASVFILNVENQTFSNSWGMWEQSHFFWGGKIRNYSQHLLNKELPGSQFLVSSTSELQSSIPKAQEERKPKHLVTGGKWGAGDFEEACKLSIPQGLGFSSLVSLTGEWTVKQRGVKKMGFLVLQLERQAGRRPGEASSQVWKLVGGFAATSFATKLKEEFYFLMNKQLFFRNS